MSLQKLQVVLSSTFAGDWSNLNRAAEDIKKFEANATQAGIALAAVSATAVLFGRTAVLNAAQLDGLNRSMQAIEGSAEGASKRIKVLNEIAKLPGLNFKDAVQGDVNLRSAGLSADLAAKSMTAFGNALGILGKSGALGNVNAQIQQMADKTQGFGVDLKILKEWVPQVGVALQNAFGTQSADDIAKMGKTGKEVIEVLVAELAKLPKATGGIGNALENAGDAWFKFTGRIGLAIDKAVDLSGIFNKISEGLDNLATWFENLDPSIQKVIIGFGGATAVIAPLLLGMAALIPAMGAIGTAAGVLFSTPMLVAFGAVSAGMLTFTGKWGVFWEGLKTTTQSAVQSIGVLIQESLGGLLIAMSNDLGFYADAERIKKKLEEERYKRNGPIVIGDQGVDIREEKAWSGKQTITAPRISIPRAEYETTLKDYQELAAAADKVKIANEGWALVMEKINDKLKATQDFYKSIKAESLDFIGKQSAGFDFLGQKSDTFFERIKKGMADWQNKVPTPEELPLVKQLREAEESIQGILQKGAANIAVGFGEWVGAFAVGVKSFKDLGNLLKSIFGDLMISTGQQMLTIASAKVKFESLMKTLGGAGIPVALGLIAAGSALKASASKSSGTNYQAIPQNSVSNYQPIYTPYPTQQGGNTQAARISIEINQGQQILRGSDIYQTQSNYQYDNGRF